MSLQKWFDDQPGDLNNQLGGYGDEFKEEFKQYPWLRAIHPYRIGDPEVFIATLKKAGFEKAIADTIKDPDFERMKKRTPYNRAKKVDPELLSLIEAKKDEVFKYFFERGHFMYEGKLSHVRLFFITKKVKRK